uniref:Uncharacterized protein n=1 Tax=Anguilla anguilla TaxID=7936 RepID=A0A0E9X0G3_ANGAN
MNTTTFLCRSHLLNQQSGPRRGRFELCVCGLSQKTCFQSEITSEIAVFKLS